VKKTAILLSAIALLAVVFIVLTVGTNARHLRKLPCWSLYGHHHGPINTAEETVGDWVRAAPGREAIIITGHD
jgi:hypothetical protein